jgi:hypothetical protein
MDWKHNTKSFAFLLVSGISAAAIYLWQPVTEYFINGTYDENIFIQCEAETLDSIDDAPVMVVRVRISNRGSVPVKFDPRAKEQRLTLTQAGELKTNVWLKNELGKTLIDDELFDNSDSNQISPNSQIEIVKAIKIKNGIYFITCTLRTDSGKFIKQTEIVQNKFKNYYPKKRLVND